MCVVFFGFFFQAEDGIRDAQESRGLGDVYKRQVYDDVKIGKNVIIHSGAVLGSDGFGYVWDGSKHMKIPQLGTVEIGDDVEIGANTSIDRASLGKTIIKKGTKIDNLVQIAHNVSIGENSIVVSLVGIAGSTSCLLYTSPSPRDS